MASSPKAPADPIDARLVRKLADILTETGLSEIEVEHNDLKIRVAKTLTVAQAPVQYAAAPAAVAAAPAVSASDAAPAAIERKGDVVKSPMVGTVYLQPQPDAPSFVKVGDTVTAGQTLLIVEAMKTMNPIPAPRGGKIVEIIVQDAQPVEFGEPLIVIE
ncbi:acetyl-CoA carboxylase biotin carboxyl carrier protein subunit [Phenylobacterium sp. Root77]|jgi:acetyl-CoA carboxylase biotin carboxyl carrier protein|uniref:acetyl-CoA carboxylase biotin carboxyl carrier protein n=1 Tax=unclassified Phenylobacterium TaxID=2640670 RepID=UPI0006F31F90|nr:MULTISPECIES: acetyl-CoA carboxylase biotin carboxyl carrier protein [unclassified Phenylobacterium]KQW71455.1 acetyl-CoA carboxylase biotin carboxyl carrier protein subunit [Phenylobacterium sp. Root1277]KQW94375.1 acetyl-CoA carboxylase biotin carboxyl carrier protein subunit [Phenylobacterium sp. Root1290]KRC44069.1 acetyl-CoA carboxylase biotin carboxyl carrier protein subunit [Phenylobacterium sp. Root77]